MRLRRLVARILGFQSEEVGSIPTGATNEADEAMRFLESLVIEEASAREFKFHLVNLLPVIAKEMKRLRGDLPNTDRFGSPRSG